MRDDEIRARDERVRGVDVDAASAQVVVAQTGQVGDERVERAAGVVEVDLGLVVEDLGDAPVADGVGEGQQGELDGLVVLDVQSGGLAVDVERASKRRVAGVAQMCGEVESMQGAGIGGRLPVCVHCAASSGLAGFMGGLQQGLRATRGLRRRRHPVVPVSLLALSTACVPLPLCVRTHGICRFHRNGRVLENRGTVSRHRAALRVLAGVGWPMS